MKIIPIMFTDDLKVLKLCLFTNSDGSDYFPDIQCGEFYTASDSLQRWKLKQSDENEDWFNLLCGSREMLRDMTISRKSP